MEFNIEHVGSIEWNDDAFKNIAIHPDRKILVQSLVESRAQKQPFDDFVSGKGLGLVINLFGTSAATICPGHGLSILSSHRTAWCWKNSHSGGYQRTYVHI